VSGLQRIFRRVQADSRPNNTLPDKVAREDAPGSIAAPWLDNLASPFFQLMIALWWR
jgi:hypothetical protein